MINAVLDAYRRALSVLKNAGIPDAVTDARLIAETAYGVKMTDVFLKNTSVLPQKTFEDMLERRISGEPLQYILGSWDFYGYTFTVGRGVLIPRSETEVLVERAVERLKKYKWPVVYDLCAGSGCIGLTIKKLLPDARVFLIEKSDEALEWLNENRRALSLERTTVVVKGDILLGWEAFSSLPEPDVIVSNPPYVNAADISSLQREVQYEPRMALDGGDDGLDFYRCLCDKWFPFIKAGGFMTLECGENQVHDISALFPEETETEFFSDFCGVERFIIANKEQTNDF